MRERPHDSPLAARRIHRRPESVQDGLLGRFDDGRKERVEVAVRHRGTRQPPGRGVVDFGPYLREIRDLGIGGAMSIELEYSPEPAKIAAWVEEAYVATDKLMRAAGIARQ